VVVRIIAGTWVVKGTRMAWASVVVRRIFAVAVKWAVEREVETISWPAAFVVVMAMGIIAAVAGETMVLPWAFVVVIIVGTSAIGVGRTLVGVGEKLVDMEITG
jgi:intracellular septation protein A